MANFRDIRAEWGRHWADLPLSNAWIATARQRSAAVRASPPATWSQQRQGVIEAWSAAGNAYKALNFPPPSDPKFRNMLREWYGLVGQLNAADARRLFVGPMAAQQCGGEFYRRIRTIWERDLGKAPFEPDLDLCQVPVRVCLSSTGDVTLACMLDTDECSTYGGLFTGCADPDLSNVYREHPCGADRITWKTLQWHDPPGVMKCRVSNANPPAMWSLDVLDSLLDDWTARGGAEGVLYESRAWVLATNTANAIKAGLLPDEYRDSAFQIQADADQISRGNNAARSGAVTAIGAATAIIAAASGPYAPIVGAVGAAVAAVAAVWPAAVGVAADSLGLPMVRSDLTAAFLPAIIVTPDAAGRIALDVPAPTGGTFSDTARPTLRGAVPMPGTTRTASQAARILSLDPINPTLTIVPPRTRGAGTILGVPTPIAIAAGIGAALAFGKRG